MRGQGAQAASLVYRRHRGPGDGALAGVLISTGLRAGKSLAMACYPEWTLERLAGLPLEMQCVHQKPPLPSGTGWTASSPVIVNSIV